MILLKMQNCTKADTKLADFCHKNNQDPIANTVYAVKGRYIESLSDEAIDAGKYLNEVVKLHSILVTKYYMDSDRVRALWFNILNN